jgi:hypothetical protein
MASDKIKKLAKAYMSKKKSKPTETSKIAEKVSIEVKPKAKPTVKSAGKPSPMKAKSASAPVKTKKTVTTPVLENKKSMVGKSSKKSLGEYADEILSKGKLSELPEGMPSSPAHGPKLSAGGRAMRIAGEEMAGEGEKATLKKIAGKTAGKIGKTFGKLAGVGALGGAVGLGVNALIEGLDATEANAGEDAELAALSKAHESKETKKVERKEIKKPKGKSDMQIKKEFAGQMKKHFPESYPQEMKKPAARVGYKYKE